MFRAAQFIVRNKVVAIGALALGVIVFGRGGGEHKAVNPWGSDSAQAAAASANESLSDKAIGAVAGAAKTYAGVDIEKVLPGSKLRADTLDNWQRTGEAARKANGN